MPHPFGMSPSEDEVQMAIYNVKGLFTTLPETTCGHRTECCNSGCPNMYYSEYLNLRIECIEKMEKPARIDLTLECLRRYLTPQDVMKPKPCPLLNDNMCSIYEARPYRCRTYGLIPDEEYDKMVDSVAKDFKVPKEKIPLCQQCKMVKVKPEFEAAFPDGKLPKDKVKNDQILVKTTDIMIGMPVQIQQLYGYLTFHDWHLLFEIGQQWLETLSKLRSSKKWADLKGEEKEKFMQSLKKSLETVNE